MSKYHKKHRRDFLKLSSGLLALPFLNIRSAHAQLGSRPFRMITVVDPYGLAKTYRDETWISSSVGDYALQPANVGRVLEPFVDYLDELIVVSNLDSALTVVGGGATHARCNYSCLTANNSGASTSASIDVAVGTFLAERAGVTSSRLYDHLSLSDNGNPYSKNVGGQARPSINGAGNVSTTLFGDEANAELRTLDLRVQNFALERVRDRVQRIRNEVRGGNSRVVLDAYQSSVQDLATELQRRSENLCTAPELPDAIPGANAASHHAHMTTVMSQAIACDLFHSMTYSVAFQRHHGTIYNEALHSEFRASVQSRYHPISHRQNESQDRAQEVARHWQVQNTRALLDVLATTPDVDGSMAIDNTIVLFTSAMSANTHNVRDMPIALIAGQNTGLKGGWHYDLSSSTMSDFYTSIGRALGMPIDRFGGHNAQGNLVARANNGPITKILKEGV